MVHPVPKPRDLVDRPEAFGRAYDLQPARGLAASARDQAGAALLQAEVAWTLRRYIAWHATTRLELAERVGMPERRLRRIMRGEIWAQLYDLVVLGRAVSLQLVQVRRQTNVRIYQVEWHGADHADRPMTYETRDD